MLHIVFWRSESPCITQLASNVSILYLRDPSKDTLTVTRVCLTHWARWSLKRDNRQWDSQCNNQFKNPISTLMTQLNQSLRMLDQRTPSTKLNQWERTPNTWLTKLNLKTTRTSQWWLASSSKNLLLWFQKKWDSRRTWKNQCWASQWLKNATLCPRSTTLQPCTNRTWSSWWTLDLMTLKSASPSWRSTTMIWRRLLTES